MPVTYLSIQTSEIWQEDWQLSRIIYTLHVFIAADHSVLS